MKRQKKPKKGKFGLNPYLSLNLKDVTFAYETTEKMKKAKFAQNSRLIQTSAAVLLTYEAAGKTVMRNTKTGGGYGDLFDY